MTIPATPATPSAVIDRVGLVLDTFDETGRLTLAQIVRRTGLPRSSVHRILERLVELRWLRREGREYALGLRLMELGSLAVHQDGLCAAARPHLHELHRATGLVVHLAVLDGTDVVYLDKLGGRLDSAVPTRVGGRRPAPHAALGKALLAYAGAQGAEFERIRETGVAYERGQAVPGLGCIAVPVGPVGSAPAAVSVCGPLQHMPFDHRLSGRVRMAATATWRGYDRQRFAAASRRPRLHSA
ncbi:IclR family transcriptional regulator [Rhodococcus sp. GXMU-t2271]|uniref:IclR family transcriptional regulator n=1 Tax=Rhodococcus sp. GXMU-t2271 TaxID=3059079 RepID=UPI00352B06A0